MKTLLLTLIIAFSMAASAQKAAPDFLKFGKVSPDDFSHTDLDDIGYGAVILQNEKSMYFERYLEDIRLYNVHHIRLKILKDGFYDDELFTINFSGRYDYERILGIRCWIFNSQNAKPNKLKYKTFKYIDRDSLESHVKLNLPTLHAGQVVDIEYTIATFDFMLPPIWKSNLKYPCKASRLTTIFPNFMEYKFDAKGPYSDEIKHTSGESFVTINYTYRHYAPVTLRFQAYTDTFTVKHTLPLEMHSSADVHKLYGTSSIRMRASSFTQGIGYGGGYIPLWQYLTHLLYVYADPDNRYLSRIEARHQFYPSGYVLVNSYNWKKLHKRQRKNPQFWKSIAKAVTMPAELRDIMDPDTDLDTIAAAKRIYEYVRKTISWDSTNNNHITRSVDNIIQSRKGNNAEINIALTSLLRHAGIKAYAAMASTSDFGEVDTAYANTAQFNAVLACVPYEEHLILLDATDRQSPFGNIPKTRYDRTMWVLSSDEWFFLDTGDGNDDTQHPKKIYDTN